VLRSFRVQGYATEAVARLVVWAFSHQNVVEVTAETLPHLRQSIRVMEKNGFAFRGPGSEHGVVRYALSKSQGR
jgi:RimJ/RimL family protein N-acetyltransferase